MHSGPKKRVLICPLDWGLGHATRCIPLIREFQSQGAEVLVATAGLQASFFSQELPDIVQIPALSYNIQYPDHGWKMPFWLFHEIPRLRKLIQDEHVWAEQVCTEYDIDLIVSDNRFGCYSRRIPSVYISHQIRIPFATPFQGLEFLGEKVHSYFHRNFQEVWIPDIPGPQGLGGKMSHPEGLSQRFRYLGFLTRFKPVNEVPRKEYQWLAMLSGPEPQRTLLENQILATFAHLPGKKMILQGKPGCGELAHSVADLQVFSHLKSEQLQAAILSSEIVLCRSGYSSLMDLQALGAKPVLIPTPGQTEQEYLGRILRKKKIAGLLKQSAISAKNLIQESSIAGGFHPGNEGTSLLRYAIQNALAFSKRNPL